MVLLGCRPATFSLRQPAAEYSLRLIYEMIGARVLLDCVLAARGLAFVLPGAPARPVLGVPRSAESIDAGCVDNDSCSVDELNSLLIEVKAKAAEMKDLESKLTTLNKDDSIELKKMLAAEECELNGFDGCSAWYFEE